ncbi:unnamed protein product [Rhodiola kirilowii]
MEEIFNDEVHQKEVVIQDGIKAQLDDETLRMMTSVVAEESFEVAVGENGVENGKNEDGLASSSSSSDEENEVVAAEKTDDSGVISTANDEEEENGVLDLIKEEQAVEIESIQVTELNIDEEVLEKDVPEAVEETVDEVDISPEHEANGFAEEENEAIITEESQIWEADLSTGHDANGFVEEENEVIITEKSQISEADLSPEHEANGFAEEEIAVIITEESPISEADISTGHEANGFVEEENEVIITEESHISDALAAAVALSDVVDENGVKESGQAESVEEEVLSTVVDAIEAEYTNQESTNIETLQYRNKEDSLLAVAKSSNGTDESNKTELPETIVNPHIISISARTVHPTYWKGCCGLLEVFRRRDR